MSNSFTNINIYSADIIYLQTRLNLATYDTGRLEELPNNVVITSVLGTPDTVDLLNICKNIDAVYIGSEVLLW